MSIKVDANFPTTITYLLVEDMDAIRNQMKNDLRQLGVTGTILEAACIADAIKIIQTQKFQFVICDWNLPDGTGLNLLKKFRAVPAFANIPFVMCTTMNEVGDILEAIKSGANEYIVKPWQIDELQKKIKQTWAQKK